MQLSSVLFVSVLFSGTASGLKCHECKVGSCLNKLTINCDNIKNIDKECNLCKSDSSSKNGTVDFKFICVSVWRGGSLYSSGCDVDLLAAGTRCCATDGFFNDRRHCTCDTDLCIGDGKGGDGHSNECQDGIKCYSCGDDRGNCAKTDTLPYLTCPVRTGSSGLCRTSWDANGKLQESDCDFEKEERLFDCCEKVGDLTKCNCKNKHLCLGDGSGKPMKQCEPAPHYVKCYECGGRGQLSCEGFGEPKVCGSDEICYSVVQDRETVRKGCYSMEKLNRDQYLAIGKCVRTNHFETFDDAIACFCHTDLCIGNSNGDDGQKPIKDYGLKCYSCGIPLQAKSAECNSLSSSEVQICLPGHVCLSAITSGKIRTRSCYNLEGSEEQLGECSKSHGGATCYCDNGDLCIGDGHGHDAEIIEGGSGGISGGNGINNGINNNGSQGYILTESVTYFVAIVITLLISYVNIN